MASGKLPKEEIAGPLNRAFAGSAPQVNRFVLEIVHGPDVANGPAAGPHQNGVGHGFVTNEFDPR